MTRILIGIPTPGNALVNVNTTNAVYRAVAPDSGNTVRVDAVSASLLTWNFNLLWCNAKNDPSIDWFCLLHADVVPLPSRWLDAMLAIAQHHRFHVLANVIPFTNVSGLTSTGWDTDVWNPRRLTMTEAARLPETWCIEDEGMPDLFNTGCLLMSTRLTDVCFTIRDRIVKVDGKWTPQVEPEDWAFSRWCKANRIRAGVTRAIPINHHGGMRFNNQGEWGEMETDPTGARLEAVA